MGKIIKLTESQLKQVVNNIILEQTEEHDFNRAIQRFLNEKFKNDKSFTQLKIDGLTGPGSKTEEAISKYQSKIRVSPSDGVWGDNTWKGMAKNAPNDVKLLEKYMSEEGGPMDKIMYWLNKIFG
jgi:hypothetical protein